VSPGGEAHLRLLAEVSAFHKRARTGAPEQASTITEIAELFELQERRKVRPL